ncbi:hypothetical protein EDD90_3295 [Streptomyces sp. Ag109_O5-1]|uniref:hypothetical protein n=1 Tax=Streptomyces sp. Ag109_O5-1 TaxID=1938851 RepID=UPI000F4D3D48|nr:hypothetical protein [Streptomyces sp. Ag109_O5-1]RPE40259.1 hypothetical protein EDD90_3295 [Streptomyces sp. Ag109_O5-1]
MNTGNEPPVPAEPTTAPREPARDARGHFITTIDHDQRAAQAARLRADNPKMTYQQIADAVGYSNKGDAWRAIQRCREAVIKGAGAELISAEAQQLDDLFVAALEVLERDHLVVSHGKVVTDTEGQPLLDDGPKLAAIREMRMLRESYRKLYGLDAEQKVSVAGSVRYEVVGVNPEELT